jgi:hypothetical protein
MRSFGVPRLSSVRTMRLRRSGLRLTPRPHPTSLRSQSPDHHSPHRFAALRADGGGVPAARGAI